MIPPNSNYMFKYRGFRGSLDTDDESCHWIGYTFGNECLTYCYPYTTEPTEVIIDKIRGEFEGVVDEYLKIK